MYILWISVILVACGSNQSEHNAVVDDTESPELTIEELALSDSVIDLDILEIQSSGTLISDATRGENSETQRALRAALYRFYSHVSLENGTLVCPLKSASEVNLSERLFNDLMNDLNKCNQTLRENKEKGIETVISPVDSVYLSSLLHD